MKSALENAIQWDNGENLITGPFMLSCLNTIINSLGANFQFVDVANPSTAPGTPDQNVFYIAAQAGTYTNFDGIVLADGEVAILVYNGSWVKKSINVATKTALVELWAQTKQEAGIAVPQNLRQNYTDNVKDGAGQLISDTNWRMTELIPVENGDTVVWNFGDVPAATGYLALYNSSRVYLNYYSLSGYTDTRTITLNTTGVAYIRASFGKKRVDGTDNLIPVVVNGNSYVIHDKVDGLPREDDLKWKRLQLGPLLNCDTNNGQLVHNETYDPIRVTMLNCLALPKQGAKIRFFAPKLQYRLTCYFWYGNSAGTISTYSASLDDCGEFTFPDTARAFRIVFRATDSYASSPSYSVPIAAADIQQLIDDGNLILEYFDGTAEDVVSRNDSLGTMVGALRRNLDLVALADNGMNKFPTLAHISDLHGDASRFENMMFFADVVGGFDAVLNSGDASLYYHRDGTGYIDHISGKHTTPMLMCIGNHESYPTGQSALFADNIQGLVSQQGYLKSSGTPADKCYYYMDFHAKSIRVIVVNYYEDGVYAGRLGQAQITWFINTLLSTPAGYGVVVMMHSPEDAVSATSPLDKFMQPSPKIGDTYQPGGFYVGDRPIMKIIDAFISRTTISETYNDHSATYNGSGDTTMESVTISADFSGVDASTEFICYVNGHRHEDNVGYYEHSTNKQLSLGIVCGNALFGDSSNPAWSNQCDLPRGGVGVCQDAFNVYSIDRANGAVRIVRIGANVTIMFERRDMMIIPYKD